MERAFVLTGAIDDWKAETEWLPSSSSSSSSSSPAPLAAAKFEETSGGRVGGRVGGRGGSAGAVGMRLGEWFPTGRNSKC